MVTQKWETLLWEKPIGRMRFLVPSLIRIPRKAFEKKVRFQFL